jgi:hypothetical protein
VPLSRVSARKSELLIEIDCSPLLLLLFWVGLGANNGKKTSLIACYLIQRRVHFPYL